jgi:hypothetical protein
MPTECSVQMFLPNVSFKCFVQMFCPNAYRLDCDRSGPARLRRCTGGIRSRWILFPAELDSFRSGKTLSFRVIDEWALTARESHRYCGWRNRTRGPNAPQRDVREGTCAPATRLSLRNTFNLGLSFSDVDPTQLHGIPKGAGGRRARAYGHTRVETAD